MGPVDEAEVGSLSDSRFAALLDRLLAVRWPLPAEDVGPLVESWGWPVTWAGEDGACRADPDYGLATSSPAHFYTSEDKLRSVVVSTSDDVPDLTDDALTALDDAFARHVAIARERVPAGRPARAGGPRHHRRVDRDGHSRPG
jgi:hypothetical protein